MAVNRKIKEFPEVLFEESSPVICDKTLLCYNSLYGVNVLLLTFRNITNSRLFGLSILVDPLDDDGKRMLDNPLAYNYYGLNVAPGRSFGGNEEIVVEKEAASFEISVLRADLEEGDAYLGPCVMDKLPLAQPLELLDRWAEPFTEKAREYNELLEPKYIPERSKAYWRCTCGRVYPMRTDHCPRCKLERDYLLDIIPELEEEARRQEEEIRFMQEERVRLENEMRLRQQEEARVQEIQREAARMAEERAQAQEQAMIAAAEEAAQKAAEAEAYRRRTRKRQIIATICTLSVLGFIAFGVDRVLSSIPQQVPGESLVDVEPTASPEATPEPPVEVPPAEEIAEEISYGPAVAAIGSDLNEDERRVVLRLIGIDTKELEKFHIVPETNQQTGSRMLSSLLITPTEPGSGLDISLYNISSVTAETYAAALQAEGITDAEVIIAAPHSALGTSALDLIPVTAAYLHQLEAEMAANP